MSKQKKIATAEQIAALNFEPLDVTGDMPSNEKWVEMGNPYLVTLRLASVVCSKTKPELIAAARELDGKNEMLEGLIDRFQEASRLFRGYADLVACAEIRQMSAVAAIAIEDDPKAAARRRSRRRSI